jgi:hypothetical protein
MKASGLAEANITPTLSLFAEIVRVHVLRTKHFRRGNAIPGGPPAVTALEAAPHERPPPPPRLHRRRLPGRAAHHGAYGGGGASLRLHCPPGGPGATAAATTAAQLPPLGPVQGRPFGETVAFGGIICMIQVVKPLIFASTLT